MDNPRKGTVEIRRLCRQCGQPFAIYVKRPDIETDTDKSSLCRDCRKKA